MGMLNLPDELWMDIFGHFIANASPRVDRCSLASVQLVCRRWKHLAEPLFYQQLTIDHRSAGPLSCAARDPAIAAKIAHWTQSIDASRASGHEHALLALSELANDLRVLRLNIRGTNGLRGLACAAESAVHSLVALTLVLHDAAAVAALPAVGALRQLQDLNVRLFTNAAISSGAPAWELPVLCRLSWLVSDAEPGPVTNSLAFLARGAFPALLELVLGGPALGPADGVQLATLFASLLSLKHADAWGFPTRALDELVPHVRAPALTVQCAHLLALDGVLPACLAELRIETHPGSQTLLPALTALSARARAGAGSLRAVMISTHRAVCVPFIWSVAPGAPVAEEYGKTISGLLRVGALLQRKGIVLLDQDRQRAPYTS